MHQHQIPQVDQYVCMARQSPSLFDNLSEVINEVMEINVLSAFSGSFLDKNAMQTSYEY